MLFSHLLTPAKGLKTASQMGKGGRGGAVTREHQVQRQEVGADGHDDHGEGEGEELDDDMPVRC